MVYCKSMRHVDLRDVRTDVNRSPGSDPSLVGGTGQHCILIQNTSDLITAIKKIAFRDSVRDNELTQSTHLSSFVIDLLIKVRNSRHPSSSMPITPS